MWGLILYAAIRFRRTERNPRPRSQKANNTPLEIAWTVVPLLIVIGLFVYTYHIEAGVEALASDPPVRSCRQRFSLGLDVCVRRRTDDLGHVAPTAGNGTTAR